MNLLPTSRLLRLLAYGAPLWIVALVFPGGFLAGVAYLCLIVGLCVWEATCLPRAAAFRVTRTLPRRFSLDAVQKIDLTVHNGSDTWLKMSIHDELPASLVTDTPVLVSDLGAGQTAHLDYHVRSLRRGLHLYGDVVLRLERQHGMLQRHIRLAVHDEIKIYPQFVALHDYAMLARIAQRDEVVRRPRRISGRGSDFASLRPYAPGEDLRTVDWKASARHGTLISRTLQVEKGQQVAILVDAGRLMAEPIGPLSRFDHALNATVMLSYVAQQRGDSVTVATFSNRLESCMPPTRGLSLVPRVLESLYRVEPRAVESDYWRVVANMMGSLQRRSLVIMLTDVLDAASSTGLLTNLARAAARHLVLCVVLSEPRIAQIADSLPHRLTHVYAKAAASQLQLQRQLALEHMRSKGILVLETDPWHFSIQLVRRYLEIRQGDLQ